MTDSAMTQDAHERLEALCSSGYSDEHIIRKYERVTLGDLRTVLDALFRLSVMEEALARIAKGNHLGHGKSDAELLQTIAQAALAKLEQD